MNILNVSSPESLSNYNRIEDKCCGKVNSKLIFMTHFNEDLHPREYKFIIKELGNTIVEEVKRSKEQFD